MPTGPKPFGTISEQWTAARKVNDPQTLNVWRVRQQRKAEQRRVMFNDLDVFMGRQRQRFGSMLETSARRVQQARRGGEYSDEIIVTAKRR